MRQEEFVYQKISEDFSFVMDCFSTMLGELILFSLTELIQ